LASCGTEQYRGDKLQRTANWHRCLDPANGPFDRVKLNIITRKTWAGCQTNLDSQMLDASGVPIPGLFAAEEVGGFRCRRVSTANNALEGTVFWGACIFFGAPVRRADTIA